MVRRHRVKFVVGMAVVSLLGLGPVGAQDDADTSVTVGNGDVSAPVDRSAAAPGVDAQHAARIDAGGFFSCAVLDTGAVRCWGNGLDGRLGYAATENIGDDETPDVVGPVDLGAGRTATAVSTGNDHTCVLLDDGTVRCWGQGAAGRLGYGNTDTVGDDETPGSVGPVDLGAGRTAVAITAGGDHTCALLDDASVRCWGESTSGPLGYGNQDDIGDNELPSSVGPVDLGPGRTATAINAGNGHTCAALDDATVRCWGANQFGQLGQPNTGDIGDNETPGSVGTVAVGGQLSLVSLASLSQIHVSNRIVSGPADYVFLLGLPNQQVIVGDWDGDAADGFGTRTGNTYTLTDQFGTAHTVVSYGKAGDLTLVGDWNDNGTDTLAVRRGNIYFVKNTIASGPADVVLGYGKAADDVYVGDWNGNGQDTFAVRRGNVFFVRNSTTTGIADIVFGYGKAGDEVLVGDWDQDGIDTFAVRRGNLIFIRNDFQPGPATTVIAYGRATDQLLVGDFDGDAVDTFAVRRLPARP